MSALRYGGFALALGLATACVAACGEDAGRAEVGEACTLTEDCAFRREAACIIAWPEGYCTEVACSVGSCPTGARCVTGIEFAEVPVDAFCLATCEQPEDCRAGYRCVDVNLPERVCAP